MAAELAKTLGPTPDTVIPAQAGIQAGSARTATAASVIPAQAGIQGKAMEEKRPVVYIMASKRNGTLYTGVTSDLPRRVSQHSTGLVEGFTKKYGVHMLVYYERHDDMRSAIVREKQVKKWNRAWKLRLIERENPEWRD